MLLPHVAQWFASTREYDWNEGLRGVYLWDNELMVVYVMYNSL